MNTAISQARLMELLTYNPISGDFHWKVNRSKGVKGSLAGKLHASGYWYIRLDTTHYRAHRLAWLYVYGHHPAKDIDHINRVRSDNRIENLRVVTKTENAHNTGVAKNNKTGVRGVHLSRGKYVAELKHEGARFYAGTFDSLERAAEARKQAEIRLALYRKPEGL